MNKLPCIDCICLPICKQLYNSTIYSANHFFVGRTNLQQKCSLLSEYFDNTIYLSKRQKEILNENINKFHSFFKTGTLNYEYFTNGEI